MVPLFLQTLKLCDIREILLSLFFFYLINLASSLGILLKEESKKMGSLSYKVSCTLIFLCAAEFSQLFNSNEEHIKIFQSRYAVLDILFGGIQSSDFLTATLDNALG